LYGLEKQWQLKQLLKYITSNYICVEETRSFNSTISMVNIISRDNNHTSCHQFRFYTMWLNEALTSVIQRLQYNTSKLVKVKPMMSKYCWLVMDPLNLI